MSGHHDNPGNSGIGKVGSAAQRDELQELLDTWGGDAGRWPASQRPRIETLIARVADGRSLLENARGLERVLAAGREAPATMAAQTARALTDRIMAAAVADGAVASGEVVAFPAVRRAGSTASPPQSVRPSSAAMRPLPSRRQPWHAAGLMAASLVAGLIMGGSLNIAPVMQELAEVAGLSTVIEPGVNDDLGEDDTL